MVKGKSKGDGFDESFASGKSYKNALQEAIKLTPMQPTDFDDKAFRLLDALNEKGRALEACELLQNSLKGVQRKRITNWRGYIYSLLRKVDESVYHEMKESKEREKEENGPRRRSKNKSSDLEAPASAPSKKTLDKTATEFVPGQPWKTPEVKKQASINTKTLRKDAAEFVPTAAAQAAQVKAAAAAVPLPASLFPPMMPPPPVPLTAALGFPDYPAPAWTPKKESKANGKVTPMKPDAQEFFPGVSAWAGAIVMPKQKAKAKARPRNPVDPGLLPSRPMSPGLQSAGRDGAGSSPSRSSPAAPATANAEPQDKEISAPAISGSCKDALASKVSPQVGTSSKGCHEITGLLTASECAVILSTAQSLGFSTADRLISKDPWLAGTLWERLSGVAPCIINGKRLVGLQDDLVVQHGDRSAGLKAETLAVQVCLKSSSSTSEGHAYILSSDSDGPDGVASWLTAMVQCQESSWLTHLQVTLGLIGPRKVARRGMVAMMALMATSLAASVLLRRRRLIN